MDRLEEMRTFVGVVEAGSITGAADRLGIAKSAVSRRLADLEERLSVQLFRRTTRRLDLTDTGRSFYERCLRILADAEEAEFAVSQEHGDLQGRLRVAVPLSFGLNHLGPAIDNFLRTHPGIEFDLDLNDRQVDLLAEGFDLAVRIAELEDSTPIARRLAPMRHVVGASPAYLAEHGTPHSPNFQWPTIYAHAIYPRTSRHLSHRVRAFVDFLAERFAGVPYWDRSLQEDNQMGPAAKSIEP
jgi:DNA-binding transcriptional LysR family regulator